MALILQRVRNGKLACSLESDYLEEYRVELFQIKSVPMEIDRMTEFLKDNFISMGWSRLGDLEKASEAEIEERLADSYGLKDKELSDRLEEVRTFVHTMQDGDYVLAAQNDSIYLGDLGDYYYVEASDTAEEDICHRRGVTWLNCIPRDQLNAKVQELLADRGAVTRFKHPIASAQLERWAAKLAGGAAASTTRNLVHVDSRIIEEALGILKQALRSDDPDRRERAAAAILQYAK